MNSSAFIKDIPAFSGLKILVAGDYMLDRYVRGSVSRIAPESPTPVLKIDYEEVMPGGAGNVARNMRSLGAEVFAFGVCGVDRDAHILIENLSGLGIETDGIIRDSDRPTTVKTRFLSEGYQLLRADREKTEPLSQALEEEILSNVLNVMKNMQAVVLSDYAKGFLTPGLLRGLIEAAAEHNIPVIVDPKGTDFGRYRGATVLTPNRQELEQEIGQPVDFQDEKLSKHLLQTLCETCGVQNILATRSEEGMSLYEPQSGQTLTHFPAMADSVVEVSGAGDSVLAVLAASLAAGRSMQEAAFLAALAGGAAVEKAGTSSLAREDLLYKLNCLSAPSIKSWEEAHEMVTTWKAQGLKVGFTNGCFDVLHAGHVRYLQEARRFCDRLILALNSDDSVRRLKGKDRPINPLRERADVLAALQAIDCVVSFGAETEENDKPLKIIELLRPDLCFKGGDYSVDTLPETPLLQSWGGEVRIMNYVEGLSTSNTISKMRQNAA